MYRAMFTFCVGGVLCLSTARGQNDSPTTQPVTRQEFDQLKQENAQVKKELAEVKKQQADQQSNADQDAQDNDKRMKELSEQLAKQRPGLEDFVIVGDANFGIQAQKQ